jgi:hypothetical protein
MQVPLSIDGEIEIAFILRRCTKYTLLRNEKIILS